MAQVLFVNGLLVIAAQLALAVAAVVSARRTKRWAMRIESGAAVGLAIWSVVSWQPVAHPLLKAFFGAGFPPSNEFEGTVYLWWIMLKASCATILFSTFCGAYAWRTSKWRN